MWARLWPVLQTVDTHVELHVSTWSGHREDRRS